MQKLAKCRGPLTKSISSDGTTQRKKIINTQTIVSEEGHYEFVFQRKWRVGRITYESHNVTHEKCTDQQALLRSK